MPPERKPARCTKSLSVVWASPAVPVPSATLMRTLWAVTVRHRAAGVGAAEVTQARQDGLVVRLLDVEDILTILVRARLPGQGLEVEVAGVVRVHGAKVVDEREHIVLREVLVEDQVVQHPIDDLETSGGVLQAAITAMPASSRMNCCWRAMRPMSAVGSARIHCFETVL